MHPSVGQVLAELSELPFADREYIHAVEKARMVDERRNEIAKNGEAAMVDFKAGQLQGYASVTDLITALKG